MVCTVLDFSEPNLTTKNFPEPELNRTVGKFSGTGTEPNRNFFCSGIAKLKFTGTGTEPNSLKTLEPNRIEPSKKFLEPREPNLRFGLQRLGSVQNRTVHTTGPGSVIGPRK